MARPGLTRLIALLGLLALVHGAVRAEVFLLVVSGIGGESTYEDTFGRWSMAMLDVAEDELGVPRSRMTYLAEKPELHPGKIDAQSSKEALTRAIDAIAARAGAGDAVVIVYFGHANAVDDTAALNLPGPDIDAKELARTLAPLGARQVAVVITSASSGPFVRALSAPNRVVVTATQSGAEDNATVFGGYFVQAFGGDSADTDKNGRVSMLEAFDYARLEVRREYKADNRLLTEHAILDDDGDGQGSRLPDARSGDGVIASTLHLEGIAHTIAPAGVVDQAMASLIERKEELEKAIAALKREKDQLTPEAYEDRLETLLVELALNGRAIREARAEQ